MILGNIKWMSVESSKKYWQWHVIQVCGSNGKQVLPWILCSFSWCFLLSDTSPVKLGKICIWTATTIWLPQESFRSTAHGIDCTWDRCATVRQGAYTQILWTAPSTLLDHHPQDQSSTQLCLLSYPVPRTASPLTDGARRTVKTLDAWDSLMQASLRYLRCVSQICTYLSTSLMITRAWYSQKAAQVLPPRSIHIRVWNISPSDTAHHPSLFHHEWPCVLWWHRLWLKVQDPTDEARQESCERLKAKMTTGCWMSIQH